MAGTAFNAYSNKKQRRQLYSAGILEDKNCHLILTFSGIRTANICRTNILMCSVMSEQMVTGFPMNHSWIMASSLLAAGGLTTKHTHSKEIGSMEGPTSRNGSMNRKAARHSRRSVSCFPCPKLEVRRQNICFHVHKMRVRLLVWHKLFRMERNNHQ